MAYFVSPQTGSEYQIVTAADMPLAVGLRYLKDEQYRVRIQAESPEVYESLQQVLKQGLAAKGWSIKDPGDHASIVVTGRQAACAAVGDAVRAVLQVI